GRGRGSSDGLGDEFRLHEDDRGFGYQLRARVGAARRGDGTEPQLRAYEEQNKAGDEHGPGGGAGHRSPPSSGSRSALGRGSSAPSPRAWRLQLLAGYLWPLPGI